MTDNDDMLCGMTPDKPTALDRFIERVERDDSLERGIERIRARNQEIRRLYGLPERVYEPISLRRKRRQASKG